MLAPWGEGWDEGVAERRVKLRHMQQMRHEHAERGECDTCQSQQARDPGQRKYAGYNRRRSQHDADLKRGGGKLEVMILCRRQVALFLSVSDSARQSAITAISSAIFLFSPAASLVCSACSMLSCALMIPSPIDWYPRLTEQRRLRKWQADVTETCQD